MTVKRVIIESKGTEFFEANLPIYVNRQNESFHIFQHTHDFLEICYVAEGKGFHYVNDQTIPVSKGDLFVIPIGTSHVFRPNSSRKNDHLVVYNCLFQMEPIIRFIQTYPIDDFLENSIKYITHTDSTSCLHYKEQGSELADLFNKLHQEFGHRANGFPLMRFTLIIQLLVQLSRYQPASKEPISHLSSSIDQVIDYIHHHFNQQLTLDQLAAMTGLSSRQFYRLFKQQTGQTFLQYLQNIRMNKSCELLRNSTKKISEIANIVGYRDLKFFHSIFKRRIGVTPKQYRYNHQLELSETSQ